LVLVTVPTVAIGVGPDMRQTKNVVMAIASSVAIIATIRK
jgi:hypothetical protein